MHKKILIPILLTLSFSLFSCNEEPVEPTPVEPTPVEPTPVDPTPVTPDPTPSEELTLEDCTGITIEKEKTSFNANETVSFDDLKVFATNVEGTIKIEINDYSIEYYQDSKKIENVSDLKAGRYQFWVSTLLNDIEVSTFDFIYVNAHLKTLTVNTENEYAIFSQKTGSDSISSTWTFNVTYTNGYVREINMFNSGISYNKDSFSTLTAGNYSLLVTYTEENSESRSTLVNYEITE